MKASMIPIPMGAFSNNAQRIIKETRIFRIERNSDHPDYSVITIGQNNENRPGDLMKFAVA